MPDNLKDVQAEAAEAARAKAEGRDPDYSAENLALYEVPVSVGADVNTPEGEIVDKVENLHEKFGGDSSDHESGLLQGGGETAVVEDVVDPNLSSALASHEADVATAQNTVSTEDEATGGLINSEVTTDEPINMTNELVGSEAEDTTQ